MSKTLITLILGAVTAGVPGHALAQAINIAPRGETEWSGFVTPYLFLPVTTTGTSTVGGFAADVDLDLGDIFGALRFSGSARAELWRGNFGILADGYFVNLNTTGRGTLPGPLGGSAAVDITVEQAWAGLYAAWRFYQASYDDGGVNRPFAFDAGIGFRYNTLRQEVSAGVDLGIGPGVQTDIGGTERWVEPAVALRGGVQISDSWSLGARAEIGGFGVGGDDLQYSVLLGADYAPWESLSLKVGWQFYGIDFSTDRADGEFAYDVFQTGPYLGGTFRF
ncbi:MAG: hypothetical protein AAF317_12875 [Pseudomonadota bacterium]